MTLTWNKVMFSMNQESIVRAHKVEFIVGETQDKRFSVQPKTKHSQVMLTFCRLNRTNEKHWEPKMTIVAIK